MKYFLLLFLLLPLAFTGCTSEEKPDNVSTNDATSAPVEKVDSATSLRLAKGKEIFNHNCTSCHTLDETLIGPPMQGVRDRASMEWIKKMIRNAPALIASGDKRANCLRDNMNGSIMTPQSITDEEIIAVLDYVDSFPFDSTRVDNCK